MYLKKKNSWLIKLILHTGIYRARQLVKYNTVLLNSVEGFQWSCCCKSRTYRGKTSKFRKNKIRNSCKFIEYLLKATEFQKISYTERLCTMCTGLKNQTVFFTPWSNLIKIRSLIRSEKSDVCVATSDLLEQINELILIRLFMEWSNLEESAVNMTDLADLLINVSLFWQNRSSHSFAIHVCHVTTLLHTWTFCITVLIKNILHDAGVPPPLAPN